jgi:hypothetical protein
MIAQKLFAVAIQNWSLDLDFSCNTHASDLQHNKHIQRSAITGISNVRRL